MNNYHVSWQQVVVGIICLVIGVVCFGVAVWNAVEFIIEKWG